MKKSHKIFISTSIALGILSFPAQAALHPWTERLIKIINTEGQAAVCKEGGIFRERNTLLSKPGEKCKNNDFALLAVTACNTPDFKSSQCYKNAVTILGSEGLAKASASLEQGVKLKGANIYATVCSVKRENLQGMLLAIANRSCDNTKASLVSSAAPARPAIAAPVRQKLKAIIQKDLQTVEAIKIKMPASTDSSQKMAFLKAAEDLKIQLKNLNIALDDPKASAPKPETVQKLEQFTPQITESSTLPEMQKRLAEMEKLVREMD